ncbi:hypothetical protein H632_c4207p0 [Helicosporidium sp. ATCC 50920]|nr:hypothetical protein H632_c4207p0 [Helicosporidium sp. ATCC 50920]|eukprot:KDD71898.1 hypothetical protein H632_c4207p0 [Helicosporidium sp. ATCC 50920]
MLVSRATGRTVHVDAFLNYSPDGFALDRGQETVPFRLTRNMQGYIGSHGMEGLVAAAGTAAAQALQEEDSPLGAMLSLFLRDDVLVCATRRMGLRSVAALMSSLSPAQLEVTVAKNARAALERLAQVGPASSVSVQGSPQAGFRQLLDVATSPANLCRMEPTWQPWF